MCYKIFGKTLISEPHFKRKDLKYAVKDQNFQKFLIWQNCHKDYIFSIYTWPLLLVQLVEDVHKLVCPSNCKPGYCAIDCFCNGLAIIMVCDNIVDFKTPNLLPEPLHKSQLYFHIHNFALRNFGIDLSTTSGNYKILVIHDIKYSGGWILLNYVL